jgi:hypothetical protein
MQLACQIDQSRQKQGRDKDSKNLTDSCIQREATVPELVYWIQRWLIAYNPGWLLRQTCRAGYSINDMQ